jgi:hypothetical protein
MNEFGGSFPQISILVCEFCRIAVDSGRSHASKEQEQEQILQEL